MLRHLPNFICLVRIALIWPTIDALYAGQYWAALVFVAVCAVSDGLDGWLAKTDPDGSKMQAYFITVDPERDTPEVLGAYVSNVSKRVTGISGPADKVMDMVKGFRVYARKVPVDESQPDGEYTMDHTASVFLLDSDGR